MLLLGAQMIGEYEWLEDVPRRRRVTKPQLGFPALYPHAWEGANNSYSPDMLKLGMCLQAQSTRPRPL
jgi:hypothetical protein